MSSTPNINLWSSAEHALDYLGRADSIPHRVEGERTLLEFVPSGSNRILDIGSGAGRLLELGKLACPDAEFVALDFSPTMLETWRSRFAGEAKITVVERDLSEPLPDLGQFSAVVSSFAIHHLLHEPKRALYQEIYARLVPGGVFCNLEHVASPTPLLHDQFLEKLNILPGQRRSLEQPAGPADSTALASRNRLRRRGLPLEMTGIGSVCGNPTAPYLMA